MSRNFTCSSVILLLTMLFVSTAEAQGPIVKGGSAIHADVTTVTNEMGTFHYLNLEFEWACGAVTQFEFWVTWNGGGTEYPDFNDAPHPGSWPAFETYSEQAEVSKSTGGRIYFKVINTQTGQSVTSSKAF